MNWAIIGVLGIPPYVFIASLLHVRAVDVGQSRQYFSTSAGLTFFPVVAILLAALSDSGGDNFGLLAISGMLLLFVAPILTVVACIYFVAGHLRGRFANWPADFIAALLTLAMLGAMAASAGRF